MDLPERTNLRHAQVCTNSDCRTRSHLEFVIHSSELMPGGSPRFRTEESVERLYGDLKILFTDIAGNSGHDVEGIQRASWATAIRLSPKPYTHFDPLIDPGGSEMLNCGSTRVAYWTASTSYIASGRSANCFRRYERGVPYARRGLDEDRAGHPPASIETCGRNSNGAAAEDNLSYQAMHTPSLDAVGEFVEYYNELLEQGGSVA